MSSSASLKEKNALEFAIGARIIDDLKRKLKEAASKITESLTRLAGALSSAREGSPSRHPACVEPTTTQP